MEVGVAEGQYQVPIVFLPSGKEENGQKNILKQQQVNYQNLFLPSPPIRP